MIAKAITRYVKIAPKKARLVVDLIRGKSANHALSIMQNLNKKACEILMETLESAVNNAKVKYPDKKYTHDDFYISKITADEGPALARYRAASMGRASMIKKRTSHILIEIDLIPERIDREKLKVSALSGSAKGGKSQKSKELLKRKKQGEKLVKV